ncbi:MAG: hypothetical protein GY714_29125 [Desulfobacterales bacterium]|nr:hypothetical protein [Desulfobacterales bacterium]
MKNGSLFFHNLKIFNGSGMRIDYSKYSLDELIQARDNLNVKKYPEKLEILNDYIANFKNSPEYNLTSNIKEPLIIRVLIEVQGIRKNNEAILQQFSFSNNIVIRSKSSY